jgi:hypothetical protein
LLFTGIRINFQPDGKMILLFICKHNRELSAFVGTATDYNFRLAETSCVFLPVVCIISFRICFFILRFGSFANPNHNPNRDNRSDGYPD